MCVWVCSKFTLMFVVGKSWMPFLFGFALKWRFFVNWLYNYVFAGDGLEKASIKEVQEGHHRRRLQRCPRGWHRLRQASIPKRRTSAVLRDHQGMVIPQREVGPAEGPWVPWFLGGDRPQVLGATCDTHGKIRPEIVMEFYANAWPTEEGTRDMHSWVKGQWIPFDADTLSPFLGHPPILEEGQQCEFSQRRSQVSGFDEEAIAQLLCI